MSREMDVAHFRIRELEMALGMILESADNADRVREIVRTAMGSAESSGQDVEKDR